MKKSILILVILILMIGCAKTKEERAIKKKDNNITLQLEATIYPIRQEVILAQSDGYVKKIYVKNGDRVKKGDLIYCLDSRLIKLDMKKLEYDIKSLEKEKADLTGGRTANHNKAAINLAAIELKKVAVLRSQGAINQFEEDKYIRNYINALNANIKTTTNRSRIETINRTIVADKVALEKLKYALNHINVKANIDGFIVNLNLQPNQSVTLNQKVGNIINIDNVIVRAGLAQGLLSFVKKGEKVKINFITEPPYSEKGKIARINPIIDKVFKNMTIDIIVKNRNYILQPGTKALVTIYLTKEQQNKIRKIFYDRKGKIIEIQSDNK